MSFQSKRRLSVEGLESRVLLTADIAPFADIPAASPADNANVAMCLVDDSAKAQQHDSGRAKTYANADKDILLPFHAVLVGIERTDIPNEIAPDYPAWESVIVGQATHLGKTSSDSVNISFAFGFDAIGFHLVGVAVMTTVAANGDELEITTDWRYYIPAFQPPNSPHSDVVYGDWEITGGTGRFENATGEGTSEGRDNEDGDRVHVYDGKINY